MTVQSRFTALTAMASTVFAFIAGLDDLLGYGIKCRCLKTDKAGPYLVRVSFFLVSKHPLRDRACGEQVPGIS
jgi:hypothetical protein